MDNSLANRLKKRFKHLNKWAKRENISCFRIYNQDLSEYPLIIDWIDGDLVVSSYQRPLSEQAKDQICKGLDRPESAIYAKVRQPQKGLQQQYQRQSRQQVTKIVHESKLQFELNLSDYLDVGLFLDHRQTRQYAQQQSAGARVLNLFAYTGSFTCYAIAGGAKESVSVEMNPNYIQWCQRNMSLNKMSVNNKHQLVQADCLVYLKKKQPPFDLIICDPPTFSNSKRMKESFDINRDYPSLLTDCLSLLRKNGTLLFSTNSQKFKLDPQQLPNSAQLNEITHKTVPPDFMKQKSHRCWEIRKGNP